MPSVESLSFLLKPSGQKSEIASSGRKLEEVDMFSSTKTVSKSEAKKVSREQLKEQLFGDMSDEEETIMTES